MGHPTAANTFELNLTSVPIDYLADFVNGLSKADYQKFQSRMRRNRVDASPDETENAADSLDCGVDQLTRRENEVLVLVASGYSRKEIGTALRISENTAASHIASIYRKLDICSIAEATNIAIRVGVI